MKPLILIFLMTLTSCKLAQLKEAPSMALAKDMCSCVFVAEQTKKYCREMTRYQRLMAKFHVDKERQTVEARGLCNIAVAEYKGERFGCTITKSYSNPRCRGRRHRSMGD